MNLGPVHTYPEIFVSSITKISATRSVYESYTTVHTYRIRIRTSQRISQQSSRGKRLVLILWRQRIQKYTDTSIHTYTDTQRIQKFLLWIAYTEISGYSERIRRTRVDARCIRIKKKKLRMQKSPDICGRGLRHSGRVKKTFTTLNKHYRKIVLDYLLFFVILCLVCGRGGGYSHKFRIGVCREGSPWDE